MKTPEENIKSSLSELKISDEIKSQYKKYPFTEITEEKIGEKVEIFGWVTSCRTQARVSFVDLYSHFQKIKCIFKSSVKFTCQTSLKLYGEVVKNKGSDLEKFELKVAHYEIYNGKVAPGMPVDKDSAKHIQLDQAHLALRSPQRILFLEARSYMLRMCREYYFLEKYCEVTPPTLVQTQVEGGSTLFSFDFYDEKAYLTQSSQLYLETVAPVTGKTFCIMPSYRAEKSDTTRHISEFTHCEAELVDITFIELMDHLESFIRFIIDEFYKKMLPKIKETYKDFDEPKISSKPFLRLEYTDAIKFFISKGHKRTDGGDYSYGDDIADASERFLCEEYSHGQPMFLTKFPLEQKPFYVGKDEEGKVEACDLLFPGIGEIAGGSMRENSYDKLVDGFDRKGISKDPYYWYVDMTRFGPCPHGGYGLGLERLLSKLLGYENIDQACLYPRKLYRCTP